MQTNRIYQVQHWPNGQWNPEHNWQKIEAGSEKEAAEKVCGADPHNSPAITWLKRKTG